MRKNTSKSSSAAPTVTVLRKLPSAPGAPSQVRLMITGIVIEDFTVINLSPMTEVSHLSAPAQDILSVGRHFYVQDVISRGNELSVTLKGGNPDEFASTVELSLRRHVPQAA